VKASQKASSVVVNTKSVSFVSQMRSLGERLVGRGEEVKRGWGGVLMSTG